MDVTQLVDEHDREVAGNVIHVGDTLLQVQGYLAHKKHPPPTIGS